jgi:membrane protease YdiL (CAAX protease family)
MQILAPGLLLVVILCGFSRTVQSRLRDWLQRRPARVFLAPVLLSLYFCLLMGWLRALSAPLVALIVLYTFLPSGLAFAQKPDRTPPSSVDFVTIGVLWLPIELGLGKELIPANLQGLVHSVVYGIALILGLWLFLIFRGLEGMKYNPPRGVWDFLYPLVGFAAAAPLLLFLGFQLDFLRPFHLPVQSPAAMATRFVVILLATALPEEILFRALIQNSLMQRMGFTNKVLLLASVIFGCAHLNNAPGSLPNWRYMLIATVAGFAFGKVFQKSSTILSSMFLHTLVNSAKYFFF